MQQTHQCPGCSAAVAFGTRFCANCGSPLNWQPVQSPSASSQWQYSGTSSQPIALTQNTSGQGGGVDIPDEIRHWNWGALLLGWIWGIGNNVWIALVCLIPYVGIIMAFVLGAKGSEWAWQNKRWDSIEHFKSTQRTWIKWWVYLVLIPSILVIIIGGIIFVVDTLNQGPTINVPPPPMSK